MGAAKRKRQQHYLEVTDLLKTNSNRVIEYPQEDDAGILKYYLPEVIKAYNDAKPDSRLKVKLIDKWIISFDRLTKQSDVINIENKLVEMNFPAHFRYNLDQILRDEAKKQGKPLEEINLYSKGTGFYYSLAQYVLERLYEMSLATEATVSQACYFPDTDTWDAGFPIYFGDQLAIRKVDYPDVIPIGEKFRSFFEEFDFTFD